MNITIFDVEDWERDSFERLGNEHNLQLIRESLTSKNAANYADADVISTFIYSDWSRETLETFDNWKLIATALDRLRSHRPGN